MLKFFVTLFLIPVLIISCKKKEETTTEEAVEDAVYNVSESAVSEANSQANAIVTARELMSEDLLEMMHLEELNQDRAACNISTARSACASNTTTVTWSDCTIGTSTATLSGVITETFSSFGAAVCQLNGNGSTVARVISSTSPRTITFASGAKIVTDMQPDTAWDGTTFSSASTGTTIVRSHSDLGGLTCSVGNPCYTVTINGLQNVMTGPKGRKWFDHVMSGTLYTQGRKSTNNLVASGSLNIWHQLSQYKAANTFNNVTWGDSTCCYPTSGSISTTLTGSLTGTTTTTFSSTCGTATFVGTDSTSSTITLKNCSL
jgi:hypothetical protein